MKNTNIEIAKSIWEKLKFSSDSVFNSSENGFENWYEKCFANCVEKAEKSNGDLVLSSLITKSGQTEHIYFEKENFEEYKNTDNLNEKTDLIKKAKENSKAIMDEYYLVYDFLYETSDQNVINKQNYAMDIYDYAMKQNGEFANIVRTLADKRGDIFTSDRECASIVFALNNTGYLKQIEETKDFEIFSEYAPKEALFNVINFTNWTYFNSEKISTKVYDVEISASLYEQLLPSEYKERSIKEDEVVCIQYRKSVVSEEQDQFLISKFNKNNFMLLQQKEIQIDDELKNKIKSICNSYIEPKNDNSYTNEIIEKIKAAGIEVIADKNEFDRILESEAILQKMSNDDIIRNLAKERDDAIEKKNNINAEKLESFKHDINSHSSLIKEFIKTGNTLLENGFDLGDLNASSFYHNFGFILNFNKVKGVGFYPGVNGNKNHIYSDGENISIGPDTFVYDWQYDSFPKRWLEGLQSFKTQLSEKYGLNFDNVGMEEIQKNEDILKDMNSEMTLKTISNKNEFNELVWNYGASGTKVFDEYQLSEEQKETVSLAWSEYENNENDISEEKADEIINSYYSSFNSNKAKENVNTVELSQEDIEVVTDKNEFDEVLKGNSSSLSIQKMDVKYDEQLCKNTIASWTTSDIYDEADGLDGNEIFQKYDNIPVPIAVLPERAVIIFNNLSNRYIYSGKAYFIDHMVNHHAELDADEFQNFQDDLNSFEKVYLDPKNSSIIFEKDKNNKKYSIVLKQDFQGNLLFYKSYHYGSKTKNRFVEIDLEALREKISVEVGNSSINHPDEPGLGRLLSALTDINNLLPKFDSVNKVKQSMKLSDGTTYGFVHNGKIYLNPEIMNSNAAVHEYTHLWDAYTQKTNPELWGKGLEIFKDTKYWNEVINDPNYQDIKDDENLVLSEIHSRICGDIAEEVLNRIAELDGEQTKLDAIDWNEETWNYIKKYGLNLDVHKPDSELTFATLHSFLSTPMKDLIASKNINVSKELGWTDLAVMFQHKNGDFIGLKETVEKEETFETEREYKDEVVLRMLDENLDFHAYNNDGTDVKNENGNPYSDKVLEEKYSILEQISAGIVDGNITSLDSAQILLNDKLLNSELYKEVLALKDIQIIKEQIQNIEKDAIAFGKLRGIEAVESFVNIFNTDNDFSISKKEGFMILQAIALKNDMVYESKENPNHLEYQFSTLQHMQMEPMQLLKYAYDNVANVKYSPDYESFFPALQKSMDLDAIEKKIKILLDSEIEPENNLSKTIIFDTETTGVDPEKDELLQISIIDGNGKTLFNNYVKPEHTSEWPFAQAVNGISPETVKNASTVKNYVPELQKIFDNTDVLISYNGNFDVGFLEKAGIKIPADKPHLDVMKAFAPIYGEETDHPRSTDGYKWKKLTDIAAFYGFTYDAHNSLGDTTATLEAAKRIYGINLEKLTDAEIKKYSAVPVLKPKPYNFFVNDTANLDLGIGAQFDPIINLTAEQAVLKYAEFKDKGLSPYIGLNIPGDNVFDDKDGQGAAIFVQSDKMNPFYIGDNFVKSLKENDEHAKTVIAAYKDLYETADKYILGIEKPFFIYDKEKELNRPQNPLRVYTFSPFGYEGSIVQVETDLKNGIPAYDIVGIADSTVKETRERIMAAFLNSDLEFPSELILQSLSPADLKKDSPLDLSMAIGILAQTTDYPINEPVLALGELELSGRIRPVRGAVAAVNTAKAQGITNVVCDSATAELLKNVENINILAVENLKEVNEKLMDVNSFHKTEPNISKNNSAQFNETLWNDKKYIQNVQEIIKNTPPENIKALEVAVAGKHSLLLSGAPGCGKTLLTEYLHPLITPKLTKEESITVERIYSIAGLDSPSNPGKKYISPFRMPHQTASVEGMCGGGPNCRPGEITLAHNGTLFLDEAAEFRSTNLQMLRVPLESRQVTLSRAGRTTVYPADFQLIMATNPCPCGNFGSVSKICLCSAKSVEMYWKKFSAPLLDRVEIKTFFKDNNIKNKSDIDLNKLKEDVETAINIQRRRGVYNSKLSPEEISQYCKLNEKDNSYFENKSSGYSLREKSNVLKVALTLANMDGREMIERKDLDESIHLCTSINPNNLQYVPEDKIEKEELEKKQNIIKKSNLPKQKEMDIER